MFTIQPLIPAFIMEPDQILPLLRDVIYGLVFVNLYASLEGLAKWMFPLWFEKSVEGDVVLVTGGGNGIGRLMARK